MKCLLLIDNSNIFIEGQKASSREKRVPPNPADGRQPPAPSWRINFSALLEKLALGREIQKAILVGSRPPPRDAVWQMAEESGFTVITHDRDRSNREKAVDTELAVQGTKEIMRSPKPGVLVIASGDRDFIPLVHTAQEEGWTVEMAAFSSAFSPSGEMATTVDKVRPLDPLLAEIGQHEFDWHP